ncbi:hypothetical protein [Sandaracinus amylolyticus]|uniref:hypothetical protein n=1 Tax=Sandaracinus amylolyticus TaxID=927083 RepID=UPI001F169C68|nr:hypothetical protein [Sandaracinus amylolyticus]UJR84786.1 Hypothetical protein I5071_68650 [Sandaracinus amylolyticus]
MRSPPFSAWLATSLGLVFSPFLVGLPILATGVGELLAWGHELPRGDAQERRIRAGWTAILVLAPAVVIGVALGVAIVDPIERLAGDDDLAIEIVTLLAPMTSALLCAPFVLAPSLVLRTKGPAVVLRAVRAAAHLGVGRTLGLGAMLGALGALPFALAILGALVDDVFVVLALPVGVAIDILIAPWALRVIARAADDALVSFDDPARMASALSRLGGFVLVPLGMVIATIALALSTPLPLRTRGAMEGGEPTYGEPWMVPGTDVRISYDWRWIDVGRVGGPTERYYAGPYVSIDRASAYRVRRGGREEIVVVLGNDDFYESCELVIDTQGHRVDDTMGARFEQRMPVSVVALLVLACALGLAFAGRNGGAQARMREVLAVVQPGREGELVHGVLRVRSAPVRVDGDSVHAAGGAWIEADGGALRIALPDTPVRAVALDPELPAALPEGTPVVLRTNGARLGGVTLRDAHTPWPPGALAVWGDPQRAATDRVRAVFPSIAWLGLAIGALLVITSFAIAVSIV